MAIEAVIFDWAGTTVDYGCFAPVQAFIEAFKEFGITPTEEEVRKPMGMLKHDHIETMMNMERIHNEWIRIHGKDFTAEDVDKVYEALKFSKILQNQSHSFLRQQKNFARQESKSVPPQAILTI